MSTPPLDSGPRPAGILPRLGASLIDLFLLFMQYNVVVFMFSLASLLLSLLGRELALGRPIFLAARIIYWAGWAWSGLVALIYFPYWWWRGGRTFGMQMLKLQIVASGRGGHGREPGLGRALVRGLGALVSLVPLGLGFLWILIDEHRQTWHDKLAGTLVVQAEDEGHRV